MPQIPDSTTLPSSSEEFLTQADLADFATDAELAAAVVNLGADITAAINNAPLKTDLPFNVMDYGAVGDGVADDTDAFQAAIDAACAVNGALYIPAPSNAYLITDTLIIEPPNAEDQVQMDIVATGKFNQIVWDGGNGKPVFHSYGWKRYTVQGVKIRLNGHTGVVAWEHDIKSTAISSGASTWINCHVTASTACTSCYGWRIAHGYSGGESSFINWIGCYVTFAQSSDTGCIGWQNDHNNATHFSWFNCNVSEITSFFSNVGSAGAAAPNGAGALHFFGCGSSNTYGYMFEARTVPLVMEGGRFELGTGFLVTSNSAGKIQSNYAVKDVMMDDFTGVSGKVFDIKGSHNVTLENVRHTQQSGGAYTTLTAAMITMQNDAEADNLAAGSVIVRNCSFDCSDTIYTVAGGNWRVKIEGTSKMTSATGQTTTYLAQTPSVTAAATVTLPPHPFSGPIIVSGNTNITSVTADIADNGRTVTLIFSGTPTFTDGSNLKLSANLVATADDTITIVCDGTNWYETGRSVN